MALKTATRDKERLQMMNSGGSPSMFPSLTAARRLRLRRRAQVSALVVATPLTLVLAAAVYKRAVGGSMMVVDSVTSSLGYLFIAAAVIAPLVSARTLQVLARYMALDSGQPAFACALWCSWAALAATPLWALLGRTLLPFFFG